MIILLFIQSIQSTYIHLEPNDVFQKNYSLNTQLVVETNAPFCRTQEKRMNYTSNLISYFSYHIISATDDYLLFDNGSLIKQSTKQEIRNNIGNDCYLKQAGINIGLFCSLSYSLLNMNKTVENIKIGMVEVYQDYFIILENNKFRILNNDQLSFNIELPNKIESFMFSNNYNYLMLFQQDYFNNKFYLYQKEQKDKWIQLLEITIPTIKAEKYFIYEKETFIQDYVIQEPQIYLITNDKLIQVKIINNKDYRIKTHLISNIQNFSLINQTLFIYGQFGVIPQFQTQQNFEEDLIFIPQQSKLIYKQQNKVLLINGQEIFEIQMNWIYPTIECYPQEYDEVGNYFLKVTQMKQDLFDDQATYQLIFRKPILTSAHDFIFYLITSIILLGLTILFLCAKKSYEIYQKKVLNIQLNRNRRASPL